MVSKPALSLLINVRRVDGFSKKAAVTQPFLLLIASRTRVKWLKLDAYGFCRNSLIACFKALAIAGSAGV